MTDFWEGAEVISTYTRAQAIEDGVLVPTTALVPDEDMAAQAGFRWPLVLTAAVAALVIPSEQEVAKGQDLKGRLWDLLWMARIAGRRVGGESLAPFRVRFLMHRDGNRPRQQTVELVLHCGPGDQAEPVLTIMLPGED